MVSRVTRVAGREHVWYGTRQKAVSLSLETAPIELRGAREHRCLWLGVGFAQRLFMHSLGLSRAILQYVVATCCKVFVVVLELARADCGELAGRQQHCGVGY